MNAVTLRVLPAPPNGLRGPAGRYGPSSPYASAVWLPIIGPSTFLAWKLLVAQLRQRPGGITTTLDRLAADLGLGAPRGTQATITRTLRRLERFDITRSISRDLIVIREQLPPATAVQLARVDPAVRTRHERLTELTARAS